MHERGRGERKSLDFQCMTGHLSTAVNLHESVYFLNVLQDFVEDHCFFFFFFFFFLPLLRNTKQNTKHLTSYERFDLFVKKNRR